MSALGRRWRSSQNLIGLSRQSRILVRSSSKNGCFPAVASIRKILSCRISWRLAFPASFLRARTNFETPIRYLAISFSATARGFFPSGDDSAHVEIIPLTHVVDGYVLNESFNSGCLVAVAVHQYCEVKSARLFNGTICKALNLQNGARLPIGSGNPIPKQQLPSVVTLMSCNPNWLPYRNPVWLPARFWPR